MEAVLIHHWLGDAAGDALSVLDDASVSLVREAVRDRGAAIGLDALGREAAANAASELAHNHLRHAAGGTIGLRAITRKGVAGLEIIAADRGPGIADPTAALLGIDRGSGGLGIGVSAAYRLVDEMDVDVRWGEGTCIRARKFVAPVPRSEVAIVGRVCPGETVSGDQAAIVRDPAGLLVAVFDGLGHGPPAQAAAAVAIGELLARTTLAPAEILAHCSDALAGTRGGVMSIARIDLDAASVEHAGVGNIDSKLVLRGAAHGLRGIAGTLGVGQGARRIPTHTAAIPRDALIVMTTDGITSRADLSSSPALLHQPPLVAAHHLIANFARPNDDALVLVVR